MKLEYSHKYDDIINMEHHKSKKHPPMSLYARSAQFAPFAALTGYEEAVTETAREVGERIDIDDELRNILDSKIQMLSEQIKKKHEIVFTYFVPDLNKERWSIHKCYRNYKKDRYNRTKDNFRR